MMIQSHRKNLATGVIKNLYIYQDVYRIRGHFFKKQVLNFLIIILMKTRSQVQEKRNNQSNLEIIDVCFKVLLLISSFYTYLPYS